LCHHGFHDDGSETEMQKEHPSLDNNRSFPDATAFTEPMTNSTELLKGSLPHQFWQSNQHRSDGLPPVKKL